MMKIGLAIFPMWSTQAPPLSLGYIASSLRNNGFKVSCFDFNISMFRSIKQHSSLWNNSNYMDWDNEDSFKNVTLPLIQSDLDKCIDKLISYNFDAIGFTGYSSTFKATKIALKKIRQSNPKIKLFLGGPISSQESAVNEIQAGFLDAIVVGEGDSSVIPLIHAWCQGTTLSEVKGIIYRDENNQIKTTHRLPPVPSSEIPIPDFSDFNIQLYISNSLPIMFSRGCVSACRFCDEVLYWKKYRMLDPERIIQEFKQGISQFNTKHFLVNDSLINGNHRQLSLILDNIIENDFDLSWGANVRIDKRLTPEILKKLFLSGCYFLTFGLESASEKVLKLMNKNISPNDASIIFKNASDVGIKVFVNLIIGFPGEDDSDIDHTINFLIKNKEYIECVNTGISMCVAPDSYVYENPHEFGILTWPDSDHVLQPEGKWQTVDGKNTPTIRHARLKKVRDALTRSGIKWDPVT